MYSKQLPDANGTKRRVARIYAFADRQTDAVKASVATVTLAL